MVRLKVPDVFTVMVVAAMLSPGCSCGGDDTMSTASSTTTGIGGSGGEGGAGGAGGAGGIGGAGGTGGEGGQGGAASTGLPATEMVSAGDVANSQNYKMVFTFGQSTQNQGKTTSPGYRMQGGLIGANGSLP